MNLSRVLASLVLIVGVANAWTPNSHRPAAKKAATATSKQPSFLIDFRPAQWAAAGIMAASVAFSPLPTFAADVTTADPPPTGVKVNVETNALIKSLEENKGELNAAVSSVVKDTPSESIELSPPASKADAVSAALNAGKEEEEAKPSAEVKEAPKVENTQETPKVVKTAEEPKKEEPKPAEEKKAEVPAPVVAKEEPKPAEEKKADAPPPVVAKEEAKPAEEKKAEAPAPIVKQEPAKVEEPKAATTTEPAIVAPKEEPKKEPVVEAPKAVAPVEKSVPTSTKKVPPLLNIIKSKMATMSTPKVATSENAVAPPSVPEEVPKEVAKPVPGAAPIGGFENALKSFIAPFVETKEEATKTNFDDVDIWNRPAIRTSLLSPDGKERLNLVFTNGEVALGTGLIISLSYFVSYMASGGNGGGEDDETQSDQGSYGTEPAQVFPPSPPRPSGPPPVFKVNAKSSKPKFPSVPVTSTSSIPGTSSAASMPKKSKPKKAPPRTGTGSSYLDSL